MWVSGFVSGCDRCPKSSTLSPRTEAEIEAVQLIFNSEDGLTTVSWGDSMGLDHWLEDYSLDQLWAMNIIGGRP